MVALLYFLGFLTGAAAALLLWLLDHARAKKEKKGMHNIDFFEILRD